jgi:hypothetical protein
VHLARGEVGVVDGVVQVGRPLVAHRLWFSCQEGRKEGIMSEETHTHTHTQGRKEGIMSEETHTHTHTHTLKEGRRAS